MSTQKERAQQAKVNLKLTEDQFKQYQKLTEIKDIWQQVIDDLTLPEETAKTAFLFKQSGLDLSDPKSTLLLVRFNKNTEKMEPLTISDYPHTKEGAVAFIAEITRLLQPGDSIFDLNRFNTQRNSTIQLTAGKKSISEAAIMLKDIENSKDPQLMAVGKFISQNKILFDQIKTKAGIFDSVTLETNKLKTADDRIKENLEKEQTSTAIVNAISGKTNTLIGHHPNYKVLYNTPLVKSDKLPVAGLSLLACASISVNKKISDASTQVAQKFVPVKGIKLTSEETAFVEQMTKVQETTNTAAKILETFYQGQDITRMGSRADAAIEARKQLNSAVLAYEEGNKGPLAALLKDSFPTLKDHVIDLKANIATSSGMALVEISDALKELFSKDPELQKAAGISDHDLKNVHAAANLAKRVMFPQKRRIDAVEKYMIPGREDKEKFIREMMYDSFLIHTLSSQSVAEENKALTVITGQLDKLKKSLTPKLEAPDTPGAEIRSKQEAQINAAIKQALIAKEKKYPGIYSAFEKEPADETELRREFEEKIVNSPEYQELLSKDTEKLKKFYFSSTVASIFNRKENETIKQEEQRLEAEKQKALLEQQKPDYDHALKIKSVWDEIKNDFTLPESYAELADHFSSSLVDASDYKCLHFLAKYDKDQNKMVPLELEAQTLDKEGALKLLKQIDSLIKDGDTLFNFNEVATRRDHAVSSYQRFGADYTLTSFDPGKTKKKAAPGENERSLAAEKFISGTEAKIMLKELTDRHTAFKSVEKTLSTRKTVVEEINENAEKEKKRFESLEIAAGKTGKLIGHHENYKILAELPLAENDKLPMAGLSLLVNSSLSINRNVTDASTQLDQKFIPKKGVTLTKEEEEYVKQMQLSMEHHNVGGKILETLYGGSDVKRMGDRFAAVIEARKALNAASEEYKKGNRQPLADLLKDSIPVVFGFCKDVSETLSTNSGQAVCMIADSLKQLFSDDPKLRDMVTNVLDDDLRQLYGVTGFIRKIALEDQNKAESFKHNLLDKEPADKSAYVKDMMYRTYLMNKLKTQISAETQRLHEETERTGNKNLINKLSLPGESASKPEELQQAAIEQAVYSKLAFEQRKWPEIYSVFLKEGGEAELLNDFEKNIVNTSEYQALLEKSTDELGTLDFNDQLNNIYTVKAEKAAEEKAKSAKEAAEKKLAEEKAVKENLFNKVSKINSAWDEIIEDGSQPISIKYLAKHLKDTYFDVSDPDNLSLLARFNSKTGKVEPVFAPVENGGSTGYKNDKEGLLKFLTDFDKSFKDGDVIYNYASTFPNDTNPIIESYTKSKGTYTANFFRFASYENHKVPAVVAPPSTLKSAMNWMFGSYQQEFDNYKKYVKNKADYDSFIAKSKKDHADELMSFAKAQTNRKKFASVKEKKVAYEYIKDLNEKNKTVEDKLHEASLQEQKKLSCLEVCAGRSNKILGPYESYKTLVETKLDKIEGLPMEGLALLAANSYELNRYLIDGSSQFEQNFIPKDGIKLTKEQEAARKRFEWEIGIGNIGGKILDSVFNGSDITRLEGRMKAVSDGRLLLNVAAKAYMAGKKSTMAEMLKDSLPAVISFIKTQADGSAKGSGHAIIEMGNAVKQLFDKDPELKKMVGIPDSELNKLYSAAKLYKNLIDPQKAREESFNNNLSMGKENKEAYVKEMMYRSFLHNVLSRQINDERSKAQQIVNGKDDEIDQYAKLLTVGKESPLYGREDAEEHIKNSIGSVYVTDNMNWPDILTKFETPEGEAALKKEFEEKFVGSPEYTALLTKSKDELANQNFSSVIDNIINRNAERNKEKEQEEALIRNLKKEKEAAKIRLQKEAENKKLAQWEKESEEMIQNGKLPDGKIHPKMGDVRINTTLYCIEHQKLLGDMLVHQDKYIDKKAPYTEEYITNLRGCVSSIIAAKQLENYVRDNFDNLSEDEINNLLSAKNITNRTNLLAESPVLKAYIKPGSLFFTSRDIFKLAIGAESFLDKEPASEPTELSQSTMIKTVREITELTKTTVPIDKTVQNQVQPANVKKEDVKKEPENQKKQEQKPVIKS